MPTQIVNISLPQKLLKLADLVAEREFRTRSELFREAIRTYIIKRMQLGSIFSYGERQAKKLKVKESDLENLIDAYRRGR